MNRMAQLLSVASRINHSHCVRMTNKKGGKGKAGFGPPSFIFFHPGFIFFDHLVL